MLIVKIVFFYHNYLINLSYSDVSKSIARGQITLTKIIIKPFLCTFNIWSCYIPKLSYSVYGWRSYNLYNCIQFRSMAKKSVYRSTKVVHNFSSKLNNTENYSILPTNMFLLSLNITSKQSGSYLLCISQ